MGINITGLMVRSDVSKTPELIESIFNHKIIKEEQRPWDYYGQFYSPNDYQIGVYSNGKSSALYLGYFFAVQGDKIFIDHNVSAISTDYLYYSFGETAMSFAISYRKNGQLLEDIYIDGGGKMRHFGDNALGLKLGEHDITQDGLDMALQEFDLEIPDDATLTLYTLEKTPIAKPQETNQPAEEPETTPKTALSDYKAAPTLLDQLSSQVATAKQTPKTPKLLTEDQIRFAIHDLTVELSKKIRRESYDPARIKSLERALATHQIRYGTLQFTPEASKQYRKRYGDLSQEALKAEKSKLISQIISNTNQTESFIALVYLQHIVKTKIQNPYGTESLWKARLKIIITLIGVILGVILIVMKVYQMTR